VKIVLMVAAGIAVGLTVALAVLVQIVASFLQALERLAPLLVVAALLVAALHLFRRRGRAQNAQAGQTYPLPALPQAAAPMPVPVPTPAIVEQQGPYLRWGPVPDGLAPLPAVYGRAAQPRRSPARPLPSHPTGDSRP
jgi:hypothetical protein